jgi:hypothetical protein
MHPKLRFALWGHRAFLVAVHRLYELHWSKAERQPIIIEGNGPDALQIGFRGWQMGSNHLPLSIDEATPSHTLNSYRGGDPRRETRIYNTSWGFEMTSGLE